MNCVKVKLLKAHKVQYRDFNIKKELDSVQESIDNLKLNLDKETVYLVFIKGIYDNFNKKMTTALVFINNTGKTIKGLHGVVKFRTKFSNVCVAKSIIDFDEQFMGKVENKEGVLIHLNIPVKGLAENKIFLSNEVKGEFSDVKVVYNEEKINE